MSLKTKLSQLFSGHVETREAHDDEQLQTRYYKTSKDKMMNEIVSIANSNKGYEVVAQSKERGEISINIKGGRTYFLVVTVIMIRPFRTAVDISATAKTGGDIGFGKKTVLTLYDRLGKSFEYVGKGLSEGV